MNDNKDKPTRLEELTRQCVEDSQRWFGDTHASRSLPHHSLALAGEVGEFCNIIKKIDRGSLRYEDASTRYELMMEAADIFTYLLNIAGLIGVDLEKAYLHKRGENEKRFTAQREERESDAAAAEQPV